MAGRGKKGGRGLMGVGESLARYRSEKSFKFFLGYAFAGWGSLKEWLKAPQFLVHASFWNHCLILSFYCL